MSIIAEDQVTITLVEDGAQGPQGIQGEQGEKGDTGAQGPQGIQGEKGDTGAQGPQGEKGDTGATGAQGPQGLKGDTGAQGPQGEKGNDGATYYTWIKYADTPTSGMSDNPTGKAYIGIAYNKTTPTESTVYSDYSWSLIKGEKGDTGATGEKGEKGDTGSTGATGNGISSIDYRYKATLTQDPPMASTITSIYIPDLSPDDKYLWQKETISYTSGNTQTTVLLLGVYGDTGATGAQGPQGEKGDTGAQGPQGEKGDTGATGAQGPQGLKGDTGAQGPQGVQGEKGDTGAQGPQGIQGEKGDTGAQGPQGIQGVKGDDGQDGKSAYEAAVEAGYAGTEEDFNADLARTARIEQIESDLTSIEGRVDVAESDISTVESDISGIKTRVTNAEETLDLVDDLANEAKEDAASAEQSAEIATAQLSIVQNIVGVLEMIRTHGKYEESTDTEVIENKYYFTRSGTSPNYEYSLVDNPSGNPSTEGWYELVGIDETIQNYVSSHLILTNDGLELKKDDSKYRMRLNGEALEIIAPDGTVVGSHGETITLGDVREIHFEASANRIKFATPNSDLCWFGLNSDGIWEMHVETTYVEKMVRYGDYAFIKRENGNMSLKWLG